MEQVQVIKVLEALKEASHNLQLPQKSDNSEAIHALLQLHRDSDAILSADPHLSALSAHLSRLNLHHHHHHHHRRGRPPRHSISRLARSIESEIQSWIDRETLLSLSAHHDHRSDELIAILTRFRDRVNQGFDRDLQGLILNHKTFSSLETLLLDEKCFQKVREHAGGSVAALVRFNRDVFAGQVVMGPTTRALVGMGSAASIEAMCSLIRSIRSPFVDEIESNGEIGNVIGFLDSDDLGIRVLGMDCVLEIAYFGRKGAVDGMMKEGLVEKLVELQRSELGGDVVDLDHDKKKEEGGDGEGGIKRHPFASCVARFAVQLEIGEGLRQREKRAFRQEIMVRVREASLSDAEAATIVAELLWGTSF